MEMKIASFEEDAKHGIDGWIGGVPITWRKRHIPVEKFGEISIRHHTIKSDDSEFDKILDGRFKATWYLFIFKNATVMCRARDIQTVLMAGKYKIIPNKDGSGACYISLEEIPHLLDKYSSGKKQ